MTINRSFKREKPDFVDGYFKWYIDSYFQNYIQTDNAFNLPKLNNLGCFVVENTNDNTSDYVLIDGAQNIVAAYPNTIEGKGQMEAMINILKISKYYDDNE